MNHSFRILWYRQSRLCSSFAAYTCAAPPLHNQTAPAHAHTHLQCVLRHAVEYVEEGLQLELGEVAGLQCRGLSIAAASSTADQGARTAAGPACSNSKARRSRAHGGWDSPAPGTKMSRTKPCASRGRPWGGVGWAPRHNARGDALRGVEVEAQGGEIGAQGERVEVGVGHADDVQQAHQAVPLHGVRSAACRANSRCRRSCTSRSRGRRDAG